MQLARIEPGYDRPTGHSGSRSIGTVFCNLALSSPVRLSIRQLLGLQSSVFGLWSPRASSLWSLVPGHSHYRCMCREVTPHGCVRSSLFLVRAKIQQLQKLKLLPLAVVATHRNIERKLSDMKNVKNEIKYNKMCTRLPVSVSVFSFQFLVLLFSVFCLCLSWSLCPADRRLICQCTFSEDWSRAFPPARLLFLFWLTFVFI
ncbi:uncharacterized protein [Drosophila suzukii]|uniref:Uncharacterized protein n=1 Tax=Drosophila suzukii TaxID=28584 RepID=A0ABM4TTN5_DROSZ